VAQSVAACDGTIVAYLRMHADTQAAG
jgi:hypothetical protein